MKDYIVPIIVAVITSTAFCKFVDWILNKVDKGNPMKIAIRLLVQDKLEHLVTECIKEGKVSYSKSKFINKLYRTYKALGGNGDVEKLMKDFNALPVVYPEE